MLSYHNSNASAWFQFLHTALPLHQGSVSSDCDMTQLFLSSLIPASAAWFSLADGGGTRSVWAPAGEKEEARATANSAAHMDADGTPHSGNSGTSAGGGNPASAGSFSLFGAAQPPRSTTPELHEAATPSLGAHLDSALSTTLTGMMDAVSRARPAGNPLFGVGSSRHSSLRRSTGKRGMLQK